jgi:hypothetical protein|tara:strand:- start:384 stop:587 length:204 start_codon:yes stop_codon:yes gene_type:complete
MGFTKLIVSEKTVWITYNLGRGMVEQWFDRADCIITEDIFSDLIVQQYQDDPENLDVYLLGLLITPL